MLFTIFILGLLCIALILSLRRFLSKKIITAISLLYPLFTLYVVLSTKVGTVVSLPWLPTFDIHLSFKLDALSYLFLIMISTMSILVIIYSYFYMKKYLRHVYFYSALLLFILAMNGVVLTNNLVLLYLFWELTSVASFLLISFHYEKFKSFMGALKSLIITVIGGTFMLIGFVGIGFLANSFEIDHILSDSLPHTSLFYFSMFCIMFGAFTKSAQFPFHIWLPSAMEAPTPVSALLHSATMVKAGIYLLLMLLPIYNGNFVISMTIVSFGLITMLVGSFVAFTKHDLKALLAYSTISQLGMMMLMIGLLALPTSMKSVEIDSYLYNGLILLIVSHACYKAALFMGTGMIDLMTGTRDMRELGGLRQVMPITFIVMSISAVSMAGLPFLSGFIAKELFITAIYEIYVVSPLFLVVLILAVVASIGTFIYSFTIIIRTFLGKQTVQISNLPRAILGSPLLLTVMTIALFFIPNLVQQYLIAPIVNAQSTEVTLKSIHAWHGFTAPFFITLLIYIVGSLCVKFKVYQYVSFERFSLDAVYKKMVSLVSFISNSILKVILTKRLNTYVAYMYIFIISLLLPFIIRFFTLPNISFGAPFYLIVIALLMITSAVSLLFVQNRMSAVVLIGIVGYGVSICFIYLKAPDLVLTQLVIETITTVLFLACFYHMPNLKKETHTLLGRLMKHIIALIMALLVGYLMLNSADMNVFDSISSYYNNSYELAGAKNVVNAILGDFRAFDTILEGVVIMIVGFGVYTILKKGANYERK